MKGLSGAASLIGLSAIMANDFYTRDAGHYFERHTQPKRPNLKTRDPEKHAKKKAEKQARRKQR